MVLIYMADVRGEKRLFERSFEVFDGEKIGRVEIRGGFRAKKRFLKKFKGEAVFPARFCGDEILGSSLRPIECCAKKLLLPHIPAMLSEAAAFAKQSFPLSEIAVFAHGAEGDAVAEMLVPYARLVSVVGEKREGRLVCGVQVRFVERLSRAPQAAAAIDFCPRFNVPTVDLTGTGSGRLVISPCSVAFKAPEFLRFSGEELLSASSAAYFLEKGCVFEPEIASFRKKCAPLLTFC